MMNVVCLHTSLNAYSSFFVSLPLHQVAVGTADSAAAAAAAGVDIKLENFAPNLEIGLYLRTVPLLAGKLTDDECARLGGAMRPRRYNAGQVAILESHCSGGR